MFLKNLAHHLNKMILEYRTHPSRHLLLFIPLRINIGPHNSNKRSNWIALNNTIQTRLMMTINFLNSLYHRDSMGPSHQYFFFSLLIYSILLHRIYIIYKMRLRIFDCISSNYDHENIFQANILESYQDRHKPFHGFIE